jgi:hypothetical protein
MVEPKREKMSKSRGNVVTPDEVTCGVADLDCRMEFRNYRNDPQDYRALGVWRDPVDGNYYTSARTGKHPVWLCRIGIPDVPSIRFNGEERGQHAGIEETLEFLDDKGDVIGLCYRTNGLQSVGTMPLTSP